MGAAVIYKTIRCYVEVEAEIKVETWPSRRGAREGGLQLEPDEEAGYEIQSVVASKGAFIVKGQDIDFDDIEDFDELDESLMDELDN